MECLVLVHLTLRSSFRSLLQQQVHAAGVCEAGGGGEPSPHREDTRHFLPEGGQPCRDLDGGSEKEGAGWCHQAQRGPSLSLGRPSVIRLLYNPWCLS